MPTSVLKKVKSHQKWSVKRPDMSHMRIFGCVAYAHVTDTERRKLDKKVVKLRFMGYTNIRKVSLMKKKEISLVEMSSSMSLTSVGNRMWKYPVQRRKYPSILMIPSEGAIISESARESSRIRKPPKKYGYDEFADKVTVHHIVNVCCVTEEH